MEQLPPELVLDILSFLGAKDVISFCSVDKSTRHFAKEHRYALSRKMKCDGEIVAKKLGGLVVPNNSPLEKDRERMKAKFFVDPFGNVDKRLEFEGEYGSSCFWSVKNGLLHGAFGCVMQTPYDYFVVERGNYRRGKKHGKFCLYEDYDSGDRTTTTWKRGVLQRKHRVAKNSIKVKEWKTFTERKSRKKYLVIKTEEYFRKSFIQYRCGNVLACAWEMHSKTTKDEEVVGEYTACWCDGESWWKLEPHSLEKMQRGDASLFGRCCERHGKGFLTAISGNTKFDYDDVFCN